MMPQNDYLGTLNKVVYSKTSNGALQFVGVFTVTHQASNGEWEAIEPTTRNAYWSMNGDAKSYSKKKLQSLGIGVDGPPQFAQDGEETLVVLPAAVNEDPIELKCEHRTWQGKTREGWDLASWGSGGGTGSSVDKEDTAKIAAIW